MLRGERYGAPVDMWGVGVVTYVILSGCRPFYGRDAVRLRVCCA